VNIKPGANGVITIEMGKPEPFEVTFETNGGSDVEKQFVNKGGKAAAPADPTKEDFSFGRWYTDNETFINVWDFRTDTVSGNITLYASWDRHLPGTYTVSFNANGGTLNPEQPAQVAVKEANLLDDPEEPTREGYTFAGWSVNENDIENLWHFDEDPVTSNITLYAQWSINGYTVTFKCDDNTLYTSIVNHGETVTRPDDPAKDGYTFIGWFKKSEMVEYDFTVPITDNVTLYAQWSIKRYTVTFEVDDNFSYDVEAEHGNTVAMPDDPAKDDYTFIGWAKKGETVEYDFTAPITDDITLYARWLPIYFITLTFEDIADGSPKYIPDSIIISGDSSSGEYYALVIVTLENPEQYDRIEWYINGITGTGPVFILDAANTVYNIAGLHSLTVEVWKNNIPYSTDIEFELKFY
jgi:uncharacterized repeat protein (TIGR02543 family)